MFRTKSFLVMVLTVSAWFRYNKADSRLRVIFLIIVSIIGSFVSSSVAKVALISTPVVVTLDAERDTWNSLLSD